MPALGTHRGNYKATSADYLKKTKTALETDVGFLRQCQALLSNPTSYNIARQLIGKVETLTVYMKATKETHRTVQQSLRPVEGIIHSVWVSDGNGITSTDENLSKLFTSPYEIELAFHCLKPN